MRTFVSVAAILATLNLPVSAADLAATSSIDAEQVVTFGYRVTAPKDRQIAYRDMPEFLVFQGAKIRF